MPAPARPTLEAIAREASVSLSTVSKVLNGRPGVSSATRRRVEELLHDSGYARRGVDAERGDAVELVIENLASEWSVEVIRGVERVTRENGLSMTLSTIGDYHAVGDDLIAGVLRRKPIAMVLQFSNLTADHRRQLRTRNIPFVVVDPAGDPPPEVPAIGATNWAGGVTATRHLLALGHRRIAAIGGPEELMCSRARIAGYHSALQEAGVPVAPDAVRSAAFSRAAGEQEARRLLEAAERPTAIVCGNDMQALGVYDAAFALGLDVPRDLSVVGFDDAPSAAWARPPLTTIHQPLQKMAEEATRLALRLRAGEVDSTRLELATTLIERGSTAPPAPPAPAPSESFPTA
ncbi:MAG: LacI family DNA-binding transcriptional regulator [Leifsonia sp.]|nr:LacI family DNA-binding transcriptional regulator [Leifsonia sp.]